MRVWVLSVLVACGGGGGAAVVENPTNNNIQVDHAPSGTPPTIARPEGKLRLPEARRYMLSLINRDRQSEHLPPLELDEGAPSIAGQRHAEDMAKHGFVGHWGSDGSVPEQRYTEAGGADINFENASCVSDEKTRGLDPNPMFDPKMLEDTELQFFGEKPPNDGHRKNILRVGLKKAGIGLAMPLPLPNEIVPPCVSQEMTYAYGSYGKLPANAKPGDKVHVEGTVAQGVMFGGVGVARIELPKPLATSDLNARRHYQQADPFQMYFPKGFQSPIPIDVSGNKFSVDVPLSDANKPGIYIVTVWGKFPGQVERGLISLSQRTIIVR